MLHIYFSPVDASVAVHHRGSFRNECGFGVSKVVLHCYQLRILGKPPESILFLKQEVQALLKVSEYWSSTDIPGIFTNDNQQLIFAFLGDYFKRPITAFKSLKPVLHRTIKYCFISIYFANSRNSFSASETLHKIMSQNCQNLYN